MHFAYARILFLEWSTLTYPFGLGPIAKALPPGPSANRLACSFAGGPFAFPLHRGLLALAGIGKSVQCRQRTALFGGSFRLTFNHRRFDRHEFKEILFMLSYTTAVVGLCWIVEKVAASHVAAAGITGSVLK